MTQGDSGVHPTWCQFNPSSMLGSSTNRTKVMIVLQHDILLVDLRVGYRYALITILVADMQLRINHKRWVAQQMQAGFDSAGAIGKMEGLID